MSLVKKVDFCWRVSVLFDGSVPKLRTWWTYIVSMQLPRRITRCSQFRGCWLQHSHSTLDPLGKQNLGSCKYKVLDKTEFLPDKTWEDHQSYYDSSRKCDGNPPNSSWDVFQLWTNNQLTTIPLTWLKTLPRCAWRVWSFVSKDRWQTRWSGHSLNVNLFRVQPLISFENKTKGTQSNNYFSAASLPWRHWKAASCSVDRITKGLWWSVWWRDLRCESTTRVVFSETAEALYLPPFCS